ncbi:antiterminator LoaP [Gordonibacter sp.]|uniref:antiterminator LoaP n=2 Tax=Gordonibacter sp. TaxID=1968902 RepID=UPI002FC76173
MWYVVQVMGGKERRVLQMIDQIVGDSVLQECFIPQYEIMKKFRGEWKRCTEILLPGYLFLITKDVEQAAEELRKVPAFTKLLGNNRAFTPLNADEIAFLDSFTTKNHRVVEMSEGVIEGDEICITKGPLVRQAGLVKRIDRHKRLAYLETTMFGRMVNIKVGLEIVRKRSNI